MDTSRFIQMAVNEINRSFVIETEDLTPEQMLFRPTPEANHITFLLWHFARVQDNVWHSVSTPAGTEPLWIRDEWYTKFGLTEKDSGTGFTPDEVETLAPDYELLTSYVEQVSAAVWEGIGKLKEEDYDRPLDPDNPRQTVGRRIQSIIVGHGYFHLGEVRFLKGLQGKPFAR